MGESLVYQTTNPKDNIKPNDCVKRWRNEDTQKVRNAIKNNSELPKIFPPIEVSFHGRILKLDDLRGINLGCLEINDYDLAFCAFDFSIFDGSTLTETSLQYSRLYKASLKNTRLLKIQASPIDGRQMDLTGSVLTECYLSNSDLRNANFDGVSIEKCDFTQSEMPEIVRAVKRGRATIKSVMKKIQEYRQKAFDFRDDFNLAETGGNRSRFGQVHVGTVLSVARMNSTNHAKVRVFSKPKITTNGKEIFKPMVFSVNAGNNTLKVGQMVEIINKKEETTRQKIVKTRTKGNSKSQTKRSAKDKNKWLLSKAEVYTSPVQNDDSSEIFNPHNGKLSKFSKANNRENFVNLTSNRKDFM